MDTANSLVAWLDTPLGEAIRAEVVAYHDKTVVDIFGYYAVQIGLAPLPLLTQSRVGTCLTLDWAHVADVVAAPDSLPFAENSIDLIVLPFCLENHPEPQEILRECFRVLRPEGRLIISSFNPFSLLGLERRVGKDKSPPWDGHFISLMRMKDWLSVLGFELMGGALGGYQLPSQNSKMLKRTQFLSAMGDRWWPIAGGIYFLHAVKRVSGVRLLGTPWTAKYRHFRAEAAKTRDNLLR